MRPVSPHFFHGKRVIIEDVLKSFFLSGDFTILAFWGLLPSDSYAPWSARIFHLPARASELQKTRQRFPSRWKKMLFFKCLENKLLLISINFTPKTSHSCLQLWYTRFSKWFQLMILSSVFCATNLPSSSDVWRYRRFRECFGWKNPTYPWPWTIPFTNILLAVGLASGAFSWGMLESSYIDNINNSPTKFGDFPKFLGAFWRWKKSSVSAAPDLVPQASENWWLSFKTIRSF